MIMLELSIVGFKWTATLTITAVVAGVILAGGLLLTIAKDTTRRREVGLALVSGACFVVASGLIQAASDISQFRSNLLFTQDLSGFNPDGRPMQGLHLNAKKLFAAQLAGAHLEGADLVRTDLSAAKLDGAHFQKADLGYAQFSADTTFTYADFSNSSLRGAKVVGENLVEANFSGAHVHQVTCWALPTKGDSTRPGTPAVSELRLTPTPAGTVLLTHLLQSHLVPDPAKGGGSQPLGHICTTSEGGRDHIGDSDPELRIYICPGEPHLRQFKGDPAKHQFAC